MHTRRQHQTLIWAKHSSGMSRQQTSAARRQSSRAIRQQAPCKHWHRTAGHPAGKSLSGWGGLECLTLNIAHLLSAPSPHEFCLAACMRPSCADRDRSMLALGHSCLCPCHAGRDCWPAMMVSQRQAAAWEPSLAGGGARGPPAASVETAARTTAGTSGTRSGGQPCGQTGQQWRPRGAPTWRTMTWTPCAGKWCAAAAVLSFTSRLFSGDSVPDEPLCKLREEQ